MARESFQDEEIASLLNEHFVPVKVDREEYPQVDAIYLLACEILRGQAGWPLTVIALPEGWPFFVATYLPKEGKGFHLGLKELLLAVQKNWLLERQKIQATAEEIRKTLQQIRFLNPAPLDQKFLLEKAFEELKGRFDRQYGGFGKGPKFPLPLSLLFLLRYGKKFQKPYALEIVGETLLKMRYAGLFDQVGFGFHRYTIDRAWKVPHFEKMLYDQGLLLYLYAEGAETLKEPLFCQVAEEIVIYLNEHLFDPEEKLFYTAESAESEGQEGLFYTWRLKELIQILHPTEFEILKKYFYLREEGNYLEEGTGRPSGRNILYPLRRWDPEDKELVKILQKLKTVREKRPKPTRDEKILTDWNAIVIAGLAQAGRALGKEEFVERAVCVFNSLWKKAFSSGRLLHLPGEKNSPAFLEDYVFLAWASLELFEATSNLSYLSKFKILHEQIEELFKDPSGLYQQIGKDQGPFLIPYFPVFESVLPSGNGLLAYLLGRLNQKEAAEKIIFAMGGHLKENPVAFSSFLLALLS